MKKIFCFLLFSFMLLFGSSAAASGIRLEIDGKPLEVDTPPTIVGERTLVPVRAIFEKLGATIKWEEKTKTVYGIRDRKIISIPINGKKASVNNKEVDLDTPAMIINGRTMVPVRFIAESMGATVEWDGKTNTVKISTTKKYLTMDKKISISAGLGWAYSNEESTYGDKFNLVIDKDGQRYMSIISESKDNFSEEVNIEQYAAFVKTNLESLKNSKVTELPDIIVNKKRAKQFEAVADVEELRIKYLAIVVESSGDYNQVISWTRPVEYDEAKPEFMKMVKSFTEEKPSKSTVDNRPKDTKQDNQKNVNLTTTEIAKKANAVVLIEITDNRGFDYSGSGFIISEDGKIVTNYHVIDKADKIKITLNGGKEYKDNIKVLDYSKAKDIAILKVDANNLPYCLLGDSDKVELGQDVVAIGSPRGLKNTVSTGNISGIRDGVIQTSAPISGGSSGGALFDKFGKVIGITYASIKDGQNLGFAVPINEVKKLKMDKNMTLAQVYKEIYGKELVRTKISYEDYARYLYDNYNEFSLNDGSEPVGFPYMEIFEDSSKLVSSKHIIVLYFVDSKNKEALDGTLQEGHGKELRESFQEVVDKVKEYYGGINTIGYILYLGKSDENKPEFNQNKIKELTEVKYSNDAKTWVVSYPYLKVYSTDYKNDGYVWDKAYKSQ